MDSFQAAGFKKGHIGLFSFLVNIENYFSALYFIIFRIDCYGITLTYNDIVVAIVLT